MSKISNFSRAKRSRTTEDLKVENGAFVTAAANEKAGNRAMSLPDSFEGASSLRSQPVSLPSAQRDTETA